MTDNRERRERLRKKREVFEDAVNGALPGTTELYVFGGPYLIMHTNGKCYGMAMTDNVALAFQNGLSARARDYFYITNLDGDRVTIRDQPNNPGHAYAVLEKLEAREG